MSTLIISPGPLVGHTDVPADKSITHRSLLFGAIALGVSRVRNYLDSGDTRATLAAVRTLGIVVEESKPGEWLVRGRGLQGLQEPEQVIDCLNSGTTARLLVGLLAGQTFHSVLVGSQQLRKRPMARVVEPLRHMGADIGGREKGRLLPLSIRGRQLGGIDYAMPVASAQVKSSLLLAGLYGDSLTVVREPGPGARSHRAHVGQHGGSHLPPRLCYHVRITQTATSSARCHDPGRFLFCRIPACCRRCRPWQRHFYHERRSKSHPAGLARPAGGNGSRRQYGQLD